LLLFAATCYTTVSANGFEYAAALLAILVSHEFGHFLQARWNRVPATLPYFIPMPAPPIGTMGAVIFMQPGRGDRRAIFDIAITGPLAGLVPAVLFSIIGLHMSHVVTLEEVQRGLIIGEPLLFKALGHLVFGTLPENQTVELHPIAFAGWVGIFITALNLIPIGQLDGGHILYALLRQRAHIVAQSLLIAAALGVILFGYWGWTLMLLLLMLTGPKHPPTADDNVPLGPVRTILGWASLAFVIVGFTPEPFAIHGM
jgi:membrane-associated protease RseP (regulator of RpoE activity)